MAVKDQIDVQGAYFGDIRTMIPELSGQHIGIIRTAYRKHQKCPPCQDIIFLFLMNQIFPCSHYSLSERDLVPSFNVYHAALTPIYTWQGIL